MTATGLGADAPSNASDPELPREWVRVAESLPPAGILVELLLDIDAVRSRSVPAIRAEDPLTHRPVWLDPRQRTPLRGYLRATHWRPAPPRPFG